MSKLSQIFITYVKIPREFYRNFIAYTKKEMCSIKPTYVFSSILSDWVTFRPGNSLLVSHLQNIHFHMGRRSFIIIMKENAHVFCGLKPIRSYYWCFITVSEEQEMFAVPQSNIYTGIKYKSLWLIIVIMKFDIVG